MCVCCVPVADSGNGGVGNLVEVTSDLLDDLCDFSGCCSAFSFNDIRKWLLVSPPTNLVAADDMFSPTYCSDKVRTVMASVIVAVPLYRDCMGP